MQVCSDCGNEYKRIATHWSMSECSYPELSGVQIEAVIGILMGDGWIEKSEKGTARLCCEMVNYEYLSYLYNNLFNNIASELVEAKSAEEIADAFGANSDNCSDSYRFRTIFHPTFAKLRDWYSSGKKVWPKDISLTPTTLKHLYCCDGSLNTKNGVIYIAMSKEKDNTDKVDKYFENAGFSVSNWNIQEVETGYVCDAQFTVSESKRMFDYMGEPLPGFKYKWPEVEV